MGGRTKRQTISIRINIFAYRIGLRFELWTTERGADRLRFVPPSDRCERRNSGTPQPVWWHHRVDVTRTTNYALQPRYKLRRVLSTSFTSRVLRLRFTQFYYCCAASLIVILNFMPVADMKCAACFSIISDRRFLKCVICNKSYDLCADVSEPRFYNTMTA